jgi:hypothetical protein
VINREFIPKLPDLGQKDAVRGLEKAGFVVIRQGKHFIMSNGARTGRVRELPS